MKERVKLLLLIPHLGGGGAERVVAQLARELDPEFFDNHLGLVTQDLPGAEAIPEWVTVHRLRCGRVRSCWWRLVRLAWKEQPDVLFSGMAHLSFLVLLLRCFLPWNTRVVVRQNTTASKAAQDWATRLCYRFLYPQADVIVCQSQAMADDLVGNFGIERNKIRVLRNPVDLRRAFCETGGSAARDLWPNHCWPRLVSVGRLSPEKGFDLLLGAIGKLRPTYPRVHAIVLGEGEERGALERLASRLGLADAVGFPGHRSEVSDFYKDATMFVLSSRYEGMPNALLEAAAFGLPLVATRCSGGVTEILEGATGAWLADAITEHSLAEAISAALGSLVGSEDAPFRLKHLFLKPFAYGHAIAAYADLFVSLLPKSEAQRDE